MKSRKKVSMVKCHLPELLSKIGMKMSMTILQWFQVVQFSMIGKAMLFFPM